MSENQENVKHRRRMDVILSDEYIKDLKTISDEELREKRHEAEEVETEVSYIRRLAQARIDLFEAEKRRRTDGSTMADLIAMLPKILAGDEERSEGGSVRPKKDLAPNAEIKWKRGGEQKVVDDSLSNIASLTDDQINESIEELKEFEDNISKTRKQLHEVLQFIDTEFVTRHKNS